ncbi:ATP synthase subunit K [Desulfohalovibrio reitneri]|uniref:ATP synthase subunit K n=1 Tax=Desulfohalovibrio reitneri TaxID=1307759 RepID=UPI0004A70C1E|nr:ATP synthase subunit K [Desulfohalovibrio reitneri]
MDILMSAALGKAGAAAALGFAALGSAIGIGTAGMAAIGAWKKAYLQSKAAPFILIAFIGAPLSQTIYGMILMNVMNGMVDQAVAASQAGEAAFINWPAMLMAGIVGGLAMGASSAFQGKAGAAASDALGETGQGFGNYLMTLGVVETVALFVMVFIQAAL